MPPLPLPKLDSRTWQELTDEARALVARSAPGWTDHNIHDPGITLIELFAWATELELFRLDGPPPAALRGFLRLLGVTPRPAGVATTVVALRRPADPGKGGDGSAGHAAPLALPPGFQVCDAERRTFFESPRPLDLSRAWLETGPAAGGTSRGRLLTEAGRTAPLLDVTAANCTAPFLPFGPEPRPGHALRLGFTELPAAPDAELSLYMWTPDRTSDAAVAAALWAETASAAHDAARHDGPPRLPAHYWAGTVWEYFLPQRAGSADARRDDGSDRAWLPLTVLADDTRALTLSGRVVLRGPGEFWPDPADGRHWLRCRLAHGGYDCPPTLLGVAVNAVEVRHATAAPVPEPLGVSTGAAAQRFTLPRSPVVAGSTVLRLDLDRPPAPEGVHADTDSNSDTDSGSNSGTGTGTGTGTDNAPAWQEVPHWDLTGPCDPHYLLDPGTGTLTFGDGLVGRVPPAGARLTATAYRTGGGPEGNVPARWLTRLAGAGALQTVVQPFPATGGEPAEEPRAAHGRLLDELARPERGITADDLESLALRTPGVPVARAHAVPGHHPDFPGCPAAGVVTVVVLPSCGTAGAAGPRGHRTPGSAHAAPVPSPALLRAVHRHLEPRRPLCTELHVVGPTYVRVSVAATLHPGPAPTGRTAPADALGALARRALDAYFDPLSGGADGRGRAFGRDVPESEVMALLNSLPGVRYVDGLGISGPHDTAPRCGNLPLCPTGLALSGTHSIHVAEDSP
ncbi:putative baseplate assembly protein [Streptomyces sp. NPDC004111]|uniref:putative baseplate assembly protein n=1 Tax=Streptomyces sp. NPDC004111 TaxID=3364690 RepID=UPI0036AE8633